LCNAQATGMLLLRWSILHDGPYYTDLPYWWLNTENIERDARVLERVNPHTGRHHVATSVGLPTSSAAASEPLKQMKGKMHLLKSELG